MKQVDLAGLQRKLLDVCAATYITLPQLTEEIKLLGVSSGEEKPCELNSPRFGFLEDFETQASLNFKGILGQGDSKVGFKMEFFGLSRRGQEDVFLLNGIGAPLTMSGDPNKIALAICDAVLEAALNIAEEKGLPTEGIIAAIGNRMPDRMDDQFMGDAITLH